MALYRGMMMASLWAHHLEIGSNDGNLEGSLLGDSLGSDVGTQL